MLIFVVFVTVSEVLHNLKSISVFLKQANYKFNPNKPGIFQWQSVDDVFLMVVDS